ncbi:MAG TPA: BlaI/MecI/CopY family transcriptional regulator [Steroidobacteraceae bacterium]|jgi:BlaI family penicillinase repressor|nr:BlaI/MecI/CopY family transcriptional regulator [Steroidobacteraceae bacterium]
MSQKRLSRLELKIMEALWRLGSASVREIQENLPERGRPAHNTVQTVLTRLEAKSAVRRVKKISNAHIYEAAVTRGATQRLLVDELLAFFGGRAAPLVSHLIESGQLTLQDVEEARKSLKKESK